MSFKYECKNNLLLVSRLLFFCIQMQQKTKQKTKSPHFSQKPEHKSIAKSNHVVTLFYSGKEHFIKQRHFFDKSFSNVVCCLC